MTRQHLSYERMRISMEGKTIFPREEKSEILFEKILRDPWACEKLMDTFCNYLFCNDDFDCNLSPEEFTKSA